MVIFNKVTGSYFSVGNSKYLAKRTTTRFLLARIGCFRFLAYQEESETKLPRKADILQKSLINQNFLPKFHLSFSA